MYRFSYDNIIVGFAIKIASSPCSIKRYTTNIIYIPIKRVDDCHSISRHNIILCILYYYSQPLYDFILSHKNVYEYKIYIKCILYLYIYIEREDCAGKLRYNLCSCMIIIITTTYITIMFIECIRHKSRSRFTGIARDRRVAIYNIPVYISTQEGLRKVYGRRPRRACSAGTINGHGHRRPDPPQRYLDQGYSARARIRPLYRLDSVFQ